MLPNLPYEIIKYILSFAPITSPSAKCMKKLIQDYDNDDNWDLTKRYRKIYNKNKMSFDYYYFRIRLLPEGYYMLKNDGFVYNSDTDEYDVLL